ncbi:PREDICTED: putative F-box/kelch-repeat protein At2g29780 [Camelina sativa]|uniref:F-box/kelch-repeat protein At2g29780 n=1 Tax=Camelina sativa TaxID=90675 RepID=A0ABM1Q8G4_CAMSA|nr:PREDICTED: putative F-box/kelch-repeat protein At2g29780 [Camelina sativa]
MALISETSDEGSNGGNPSKKLEELHKNPKEEDDEENQSEKPQEDDLAPNPRQNPEVLIGGTVAHVRRCHYPVLYALIGFPLVSLPCWYILNRNIPRNNSLRLIRITSLPPMNPGCAVVTIGYKMYVMGGWIGLNQPASTVFVIDCRYHTCGYLPNMHRARYRAAAGVVEEKIYVIGGCEKRHDDWIEVFDVEKRTWSTVPDPSDYKSSLPEGGFVTSLVMQNRIYIMNAMRDLVYEPRQGTWQSSELGTKLMHFWRKPCCVIEDLLYSFDPRCVLRHPILVYDPNKMVWTPLKGVDRLPYLKYFECKMENLGGKLMVLGTSYIPYNDTWCIEITLERREGGEMWGTVDSVVPVLSSLNSPYIDLCRSVTF